MSLEVANTILAQLGGNKFRAMTGAHNFVGGSNNLSFRIPGKNFAKDSINCVRIELTPADDYTVEFLRIRGHKFTVVSRSEGVYCDMLQEVFEHATGLRTRLF